MTPLQDSETDGMQDVPGNREDDESAEFCWSVHLAARHPGRAVLAGAVVLAVGGWGWNQFGSPVMGALTVLVLLGAVGEFLFPIRYRLTSSFAEARGPLSLRRIEWTEVRRVYRGEEGIKLSPLPHAGPREAFRGVLLRPDENAEQILMAIRRYRTTAAHADAAPPGS